MTPQSPFRLTTPTPYYPGYALHYVGGDGVKQWEFNGWKAESLSWKTTCYLHGGLSGFLQVVYAGPEAADFMADIFVNNISKFRVGAAKHAIACDDGGLIAGHGVLQRLAEDRFRLFGSGPWSIYQHALTKREVTQELERRYWFQVAGPTSLDALEAATGETLRDLAFLRFRDTRIAGKTVQIMRVGMAGTLAYELHGPAEEGAEIYDAVFRAGEPFGMERLGWQTFPVNHVEGGFPQLFWTFTSSIYSDPGFLEFAERQPFQIHPHPTYVGSVDPQDRRARYRTPFEVGWERSIRFDHDFVGRGAVEAESRSPQRTVVTLVWNPEDVIDIYASLFRPGEEYKYLELPATPAHRKVYAHADHVHKDGRAVGVSSGTVYSYHFREVISHCTLDLAEAALDNEVTVLWGDHGGRIKEVRAKVARFPYLSEGRNQSVDVSGLPA